MSNSSEDEDLQRALALSAAATSATPAASSTTSTTRKRRRDDQSDSASATSKQIENDESISIQHSKALKASKPLPFGRGEHL